MSYRTVAVGHVVVGVELDGSGCIGDGLLGLVDARYRVSVSRLVPMVWVMWFQLYGTLL